MEFYNVILLRKIVFTANEPEMESVEGKSGFKNQKSNMLCKMKFAIRIQNIQRNPPGRF